MWFDVTESLNACLGFKEKVFQIFEKERPSRMEEASYKRISQYMKKHATDNEDSYFEGLVDPVLKSERTVATKKRDAEGEILFVCKSFEEDDMIRKRNVPFLKGLLPGKMDKRTENKLGLTDPKPDYTFGIRRNDRPLPGTAPNDQVETIIGVAPGMIHPFFVIESKGCEAPIDLARNQAIRAGATIVNARMHLNAIAEDEGQEKLKGADLDAIAFSCTWDVTVSELWIHWHETLDDGKGLFHMNRLGQYLTGNQEHLTQFRHDVHNILDWGVLTNKGKCEEAVQEIMIKARRKNTKQSEQDGSSGLGKLKAISVAGS